MGRVNYDFADETVVVTGGTSGIGRAMALAFGDAGATVLVGDLRAEPPDDRAPTHAAIEDRGGTAAFAETDVSEAEDVAALVEAAREFGGVSVMVNNAGIIRRKGVLDATAEDYDAVNAVNARAVLLGCTFAGRDMIDRNAPGAILNTASISAEHSLHDHICYDAAKGAVRMITRTAALDLAEHDIRVNAIAPGFTATNLSEGGPEAVRETVASGDTFKPVPMGRAGEPEEVADTAVFLCSDAASYVTGELCFVDGGYQVV
jgi:NAD(P)-dependent dehydrogenase (short-subunit alcohol dehydrogenase family)